MKKGTIFNIQKFSVHDGPGIRTTVFFKGCPLECKWCHNPEGLACERELAIFQSRCIGCGMCIAACPNHAVELASPGTAGKTGKSHTNVWVALTDREKCTVCGKCADICPAQAREIAGRAVTSGWVMEQILKDRIFYDQSGGGVTFSGGEPFMQPEFLLELLMRCKDEDISTAVDTSGYVSWESIEQAAPLTDLFLYDIKIMDPARHAKYTGVPNQIILDNLAKLSRAHESIIARIPIIPGVNDDEANIESTGKFLSSLGITRVSILPYHNMGSDKYTRLGRIYAIKDTSRPQDEVMLKVKGELEKFGLAVKIGG